MEHRPAQDMDPGISDPPVGDETLQPTHQGGTWGGSPVVPPGHESLYATPTTWE